MSRILAKFGHFEGAPTVGGFRPDFRPPQLRCGFHFPDFAISACFVELISRVITPDEPHFGQNGHSEGAPTLGGFRSYFRPTQLRAVSYFQFYDFTVLLGTIFRIATSGGSHFGSKTAILRGRQRWVDFGPISARRTYEGVHFPTLRFYRTVETLISRIATPDESHFCQKRPFWWAPTVGGFHSDFFPSELRSASISQFYLVGANLQNRHFRWVAFRPKPVILRERRWWADFSLIPARRNYEGLHFPILRFTILPKANFPNRHIQRVAFLVKNGHSEGSPNVGGRFQPDFRLPQLRGFPLSDFTILL